MTELVQQNPWIPAAVALAIWAAIVGPLCVRGYIRHCRSLVEVRCEHCGSLIRRVA